MKLSFSSEQIKFVSGVLSNLGFVALGSIVLPFIFPAINLEKSEFIFLGVILTLSFWLLGFTAVKNIKL